MGKTNYLNKKPQHAEAKTVPQEPTPAKEVEPQEPVLLHKDARSKEHSETDIIKDTKTDRKSTRLNSSHSGESRMPSSA